MKVFLWDGIFYSKISEFLTKELAEDGYTGAEIRILPTRIEIILDVTRILSLLDNQGKRIKELGFQISKLNNFTDDVRVYVQRKYGGLCAIAQADMLKRWLLEGVPVKKSCYSIVRSIMESGAKGCEVILCGKLRENRAKVMKFKEGCMISSGHAVEEYVDSAIKHVVLRKGVLVIKVKIMLDWDPRRMEGPNRPLPDVVTFRAPADEEEEYSR